MKRRAFVALLAIVSVVAVAFAFSMKSKQSNASTNISTVNWVLDNQMTPFATAEIWQPATGIPPTTAQNAVNQSLGLVGGADNVQSTIRVRYVLVSYPWDNSLKNSPMWVVEIDKFPSRSPITGRTYNAKTEILIDANTGKYWGRYEAEIRSNKSTPAP